jgi:hypothetical protein
MNRSETIGALAKAMAAAQRTLTGAVKDSTNPHFKNDYADLASVWDACQAVLPANGIAVFQPTTVRDGAAVVTTLLVHESGEWISEDLPMPVGQQTAQAVGSAITYGRRYGLAAMVGVAPKDDDGNEASKQQPSRPVGVARQAPPAPPVDVPAGLDAAWAKLTAAAGQGNTPLREVWLATEAPVRDYVFSQRAKDWEALKAQARTVAVAS